MNTCFRPLRAWSRRSQCRLGINLGIGLAAIALGIALGPNAAANSPLEERPRDRPQISRAATPEPLPDFGSPRLGQQLEQYLQYLTRVGRPDVLIVGSSRSLQGIDPDVLARELARRGHGNLRIYNFSINGATAQVVDWVVRELLPPDRAPALILWGDGSRAFNAGRPDLTFAAITSSPGHRAVATGQRPTPAPPPDLGERFAALGLGTYAIAAGCPIDGWSPVGGRLLDRAQRSLTRAIACQDTITLRALEAPAIAPVDPRRFAMDPLTPTGFLADARRFDPARYYAQFPRVAGQYDGSYVPFRLDGPQDQAARRLLNHARSRGIALAFVNLPLSRDYLDPVRLGYEQQFNQYLAATFPPNGGRVLDYLLLWPDARDRFADPSHINRHGAAAVAQELARDRALPWPNAPRTPTAPP
ncbi:MAG: hypothetical protein Fur0042_14910 [Cyanophyceae cyanobacterium]